jgi:hypothetical protein
VVNCYWEIFLPDFFPYLIHTLKISTLKKFYPLCFIAFFLHFNLYAQFENTVDSIHRNYSPPVGFIENKGQIIDQYNHPNPAVKYLYCGNGMNVQLKTNGFSYDTYTIEKKENPKDELQIQRKLNLSCAGITYSFHRIDVELIGSNPDPIIIDSQVSESYSNYFTAGIPNGGISNVHSYKEITYQDIYPNIDLQFIVDPKLGFKYNFIVHPGGDYKKIKLRYRGADKINLVNGKISISTSNGKINESIPLSYLKESGEAIKVNYAMVTENEGGESFVEFAFAIDKNTDTEKTLVIDPIPNLLWGTYYGGTGVDNATSVALDPSGNVYVAGLTTSITNIATAGAYQVISNGNLNDAFVAKFNSTGTNLIWGTYYGASGNDMALSIAIDGTGNLLITGLTNSIDSIATTGAWQTIYGGGSYDAFVAKFNSAGTNLIWGTYYGGSSSDFGYSITVDQADEVLITGYTKSIDSIATAGTHQTVFGGVSDAFVAKLNSSGTNRIWGTYYGGSVDDWGNSIVLDATGNIYLTGFTSSPDGIANVGAWRTAPIGNGDGFVAELNSTGTTLLSGTYYGGNQEDQANDIAIDGQGNINITGYTGSFTGISTLGEWQTSFGGTEDVFVSKFNPACTNLIWGTYYGGNGDDEGYSIAIDGTDNLFVTGFTKSAGAIATAGSWQNSFGGYIDAFVAKFNSGGTNLQYGSYYGGSGQDEGLSIVLDGNNNLFITGWTTSTDSISTTGVYQDSLVGNTNCFIAQFDGVNSGISFSPESYFSFDAYPVPTSDFLYLQINAVQNETVQIKVTNLLGQVEFVKKEKGILSTLNEAIDFSDFANGIYLVNISNGENSFTRRIEVQH